MYQLYTLCRISAKVYVMCSLVFQRDISGNVINQICDYPIIEIEHMQNCHELGKIYV